MSSATSALSFVSKGLRDVRDSAYADLRLIRRRVNSFKLLPTSFRTELDFVKKLHPKFTEFSRVYSSPDFSRKVFEKWTPPTRNDVEFSAVKGAIDDEFGCGAGDRVRVDNWNPNWNRVSFKDFKWDWKGAEDDGYDGHGMFKDWEPFKAVKMMFKEFQNHKFIEKFKSNLKAFRWDSDDTDDMPPLDVPELLAYFVKQSGPFLDQLGVKKDICDNSGEFV